MINSIQFLRAVAAFLVLLFHTQQALNKFGYGEAFIGFQVGVDIFFVISGFIIFLIAHNKKPLPGDFLVRRLIRIVPLYWLYTGILVALLLLFPDAFQQLKFDLSNVLNSYLFLLSKNNLGDIGTVLSVGWTLAFEMYFYVLFTVSLMLPPRIQLLFLVVFITTCAILSLYIKNIPIFLSVLFSALPLEFLGGCLLAKLYLLGKNLHPLFALAAIACGIVGIYYASLHGNISSAFDASRVEYFALPAILMVYGVVSLESVPGITFPRITLLLGDASYSIYLCHNFVIAALSKCFVTPGLTGHVPPVTLFITAIAASLMMGILSFRFFEKPVTASLNHRLNRHGSKAANFQWQKQ